ncbi:hypothetical protein ACFIOY_22420 [Bradyrhizobium sp. TZ2]
MEGFELRDGEFEPVMEIGYPRPSEQNGRTSFPLKLLSNSKRSYFENRIERAEYGGPEKSAGSENSEAAMLVGKSRARIGKSLWLLGLIANETGRRIDGVG